MKRVFFLTAFAVLTFQTVCAQSYFSDSNVGNAVVLRDPARQSSTEIDAAIFNPAGTAWLKEGFHISLSGIASWKSVDSQINGREKQYNVEHRNITPAIQLAYKTGDWTFSASFASEGGMGKIQGDNGISMGEGMFNGLVDQYNTNFNSFMTLYDLAYQLGVAPELNIHKEDELRLNSSDYSARLNNWTTRVGASYKFNDWLSGHIGIKLNCIHYSSQYEMSTEIFRPSTNTTFAPESYHNVVIEQLNASSIQNNYIQSMKEYLQINQTFCNTFDLLGESIGTPISSNQWGLSPIIGLNAHFDRFNFGIKYEFQSIKLNDTDVLNPIKTPAELSVGASWQALNWLKVAVGSNIFFKTSDLGFNGLQEQTTYNLSGSLTFNLPKNWIISGGYSYYRSTEINDPLLNMAVAYPPMGRNQFSLGLGYDINKNLQFNVGANVYVKGVKQESTNQFNFNFNGESHETLSTSYKTIHTISRMATIGIGLNYSF